VAGAAVNVLLNLVLIPRYAAMGASWATVISYTLAVLMIPMLLAPVRPIIVLGLKVAMRPLLLALAIVGGLQYVGVTFWWKLIFAAVAFGGGGWMIGAVTSQDVNRLVQMLRLRPRW
jgi:O-antigen/teichoic acid export membrane protein